MRYTHLLFDLDNTLLDFTRSARVGFSVTMQHYGLADTPEYFDLYERHNHYCWSERERGRMSLATLRRERFQRFADEIGHGHLDGLAMNTTYLDAIAAHPYPVAGAEALLRALQAAGIRLAIITNGLQEVQRKRIAAMRWTDYFDAIVVSDEIGTAKPDPAFFDHTFRALDQPDRTACLIVGDNLHSDILGGVRYGVDTCWFNYRRAEPPVLEFAPTYVIEALSALPGIVKAGVPK